MIVPLDGPKTKSVIYLQPSNGYMDVLFTMTKTTYAAKRMLIVLEYVYLLVRIKIQSVNPNRYQKTPKAGMFKCLT